MRSTVRCSVLALSIFALAACDNEEPEVEPAAVEEEAGVMEDVDGMPEMSVQGGVMDQMAAHMRRMESMPTDSTPKMLPMHRQMVADLIAQMNREMSDMGMATDPAWDATVNSLRADLRRMPEMSAAELEALMPDHRARVARLMEMHHAMMAEIGSQSVIHDGAEWEEA